MRKQIKQNGSKKFHNFDFVKAAKSVTEAALRVKLLALEQIKIGKSHKKVAKIFQVHERSVKAWEKRFEKGGVEELKLKPGRGRKCILPKNEISRFKQAITELQNQRKGGRINVADITKMAREKFGVTYKEKGMYDFLHRINMVWISARSVHPSCNPAAQEAFKKTL